MTEKVEAVQRMQNYIEAHLTERITLTDLSEAAFFSPWYSARLFKEMTGLAPADYIRRLKLSKSALRLRDETCRIIDVAYDMGFRSVDSYQRAFFREFGCNPKEYALNPIPLSLFTPYGVKFRELWKEPNNMENIKNVFIQVIDKPHRKVIIKRGQKATGYWEYCQEVGCDVWGLLTSMKSLCGEPVCMWLPEQYRRPGTSKYVQGVEVAVDYNGPVPDEFDVIMLPKAKYLMFQGEPFAEEYYCEAIEVLQASMDRYDPAVIGYAWDDTNPRIQLEPIGKRGYIELRAVK
ncbi:helix-turn-helix transcriptional regulator [Clostridium omnivorum]|uniref:AraC family transcriptional regulator n=1 Tax=Clostridium omnivorum TaxID=1604902 RepID=A0ABQ5N9E1_9CLOT|nr:AraC family transcriptional regulator [Clostridium sp. E14]GLC31719.1 AraC family transcriptional regulator [Clostridium sp. E14]